MVYLFESLGLFVYFLGLIRPENRKSQNHKPESQAEGWLDRFGSRGDCNLPNVLNCLLIPNALTCLMHHIYTQVWLFA